MMIARQHNTPGVCFGQVIVTVGYKHTHTHTHLVGPTLWTGLLSRPGVVIDTVYPTGEPSVHWPVVSPPARPPGTQNLVLKRPTLPQTLAVCDDHTHTNVCVCW